MERFILTIALAGLVLAASVQAREQFPSDVVKTASGDLTITFVGHGSLVFSFGGTVVHVDPFGSLGEYGALPKADIILITHEHPDHLDPSAIGKVRTGSTVIVLNRNGAKKLGSGVVMNNGDIRNIKGILVEAVPAYNLVHKRESGEPFHPQGSGNGYILTFGDTRVYVAGDTEDIPEMKAFTKIDIAFLPMNLPYTMTPEMAASAAKMLKPRVLYPYHTGETDLAKLEALMKGQKGTEVRIRSMK